LVPTYKFNINYYKTIIEVLFAKSFSKWFYSTTEAASREELEPETYQMGPNASKDCCSIVALAVEAMAEGEVKVRVSCTG
jgi:hypothetical protein